MVCPVCTTENQAGAKFCQECAHRLDYLCAHCGASVPVSAKFCPDCGIRLERICPHCAAITLPNAKFCQACGHRLDQRCPHCGVQTPPNAAYCQQCGGRIDLTCPHCRAITLIGASYCNACGGGLALQPGVAPVAAPAQPASVPPVVTPPTTAAPAVTPPTPAVAPVPPAAAAPAAPAETPVPTPAPAQAFVPPPVVPAAEPPAPAAPLDAETPVAEPSPSVAPAPPVEAAAGDAPAADVIEAAPPAEELPPAAAAEEPPLLPVGPVAETEGPVAADTAELPEPPAAVEDTEAAAAVAEAEAITLGAAPASGSDEARRAAAIEPLPALPPRLPALDWHSNDAPDPSAEEVAAYEEQQSGPRTLEDERRLVSVLFGDVSGFTAMSEKLDPEDVKNIMDMCLKGLADQVDKYDGEVDKFEGDLIMAVWGARNTHEDDAERCVLAAWEMQNFLNKFSRDLERRRGFKLRMRIGINTGEVITGSVGSRREKDFTVYGDVVNTASRFESNATPGRIMVGLKTFNLTKHMVDYKVLEPIMVKGKTEPLPVFEVDAIREDRGRRRGIAGLDSPMVGRDSQLDLAYAAFRSMLDRNEVHRMTILGVPGQGKSRLLGELQNRIDGEQPGRVTWLKGRALPYGQGITYYPLAEILKSAVGIRESDSLDVVRTRLIDGAKDLVARALAAGGSPVHGSVEEEAIELAHRLGYAIGVAFPDSRIASVNPANIKDEMYWAWRLFFLRHAELGPTAVVIEDIHWADDIILELVERLLGSVSGHALMLVCPSRPELLERSPEWGKGPKDTLIHLSPLQVSEAVQVIDFLLEPNRLPRKSKEIMASRAGGIPFFIEEIIKVLMESGAIIRTQAGVWVEAQAGKAIEVPDTIMATVAARLDKLPQNEKNLLQRASVIGERFWESALAYPNGFLAQDDMMTLWNTVQKEWAHEREHPAFDGDREFAFSNSLARDVAYGGLTRARRTREHRRVAEWLERRVGDRIDEFIETIAHHYAQAVPSDLMNLGGDLEPVLRAIQFGWVASERSRQRQAYRDAAERLEKVLQWVRDLTFIEDGPQEVYGVALDLLEMRLGLARAASLEPLGQYEAALDLLNFVVEQAQSRAMAQLEGQALVQKARILRVQGELAEAEAATVRAAELLAAAGDPAGQAQAKLVLGEVFSDQAKLTEFEAACREAIELAQQGHSRWVEARGLTLLGTACVYQGRVEEAQRFVGKAVETYREMADRRGRATSLVTFGRILHMRGHMPEAIAAISEAVSVFEELGDHRSMASASFALGLIRFEQGDLPAARRAAETGLERAAAINEAAIRIRSLLLLSQVEIESSMYAEALAHLKDAEELCVALDQKSVLPEVYRTLGMAHWGAGNLAEAESYARKGREVVAEDDLYSQGTTWLVLARVLTATGNDAEGEAAFQQGLAAIEESEEQYEIGMGHEWYAEHLLRHGRVDEAREHLEKSREAYANLNSSGRVSHITSLLESLPRAA